MQADAGAPWTGTIEDPASYTAGLGWHASLTQIVAPTLTLGAGGTQSSPWPRWTCPAAGSSLPRGSRCGPSPGLIRGLSKAASHDGLVPRAALRAAVDRMARRLGIGLLPCRNASRQAFGARCPVARRTRRNPWCHVKR